MFKRLIFKGVFLTYAWLLLLSIAILTGDLQKV